MRLRLRLAPSLTGALGLLAACSCDGRSSQKEHAPAASPRGAAVGAADAAAAAAVDAPAAAADCPAVIFHLRRVLLTELAGVPGAVAPMGRALRVAAESCRQGGWPEPLRRCLLAAPLLGPRRGAKGLWPCAVLVPEPLRQSLEAEIRAVL